MTDEIRKKRCEVVMKYFTQVYDPSAAGQWHIVSLQELNVELSKKGLPLFKDKQELGETIIPEVRAAAERPDVTEQIVRNWIETAVLN